jgi:hypothetical protein
VEHFGHSTQRRICTGIRASNKIRRWAAQLWTFADAVPIENQCGSVNLGTDTLRSVVRKRPVGFQKAAMMDSRQYETRLASLFPGAALARCALRRKVFYWSARQPSVLPLDLSCAHCEGEECPIFPERGRRGGGWFSSLSALPAGMLAWNSSMARYAQHCIARFAVDRRERTR